MQEYFFNDSMMVSLNVLSVCQTPPRVQTSESVIARKIFLRRNSRSKYRYRGICIHFASNNTTHTCQPKSSFYSCAGLRSRFASNFAADLDIYAYTYTHTYTKTYELSQHLSHCFSTNATCILQIFMLPIEVENMKGFRFFRRISDRGRKQNVQFSQN